MSRVATVGHTVPEFETRALAGLAVCGVEACEIAPHRKGLCGAHFMDYWRNGLITREPLSSRCRTCDTPLKHGARRPGSRRYCSERCSLLSIRYGLTPPLFHRLVATTSCDACGTPAAYGGTEAGSLHVDHCHDTLAVRGFLCPACNQALGHVGDSASLLNTLAKYVRSGSTSPRDVPSVAASDRECDMCGAPRRTRAKGGGRPIRYCDKKRCGVFAAHIRGYGLQPGQYRWLLLRANGRCEACLAPFDEAKGRTMPVVDHDHTTGEIRGILHDSCNVALGLLGDDPNRVEALASYISA